jgi:hypothetical protein
VHDEVIMQQETASLIVQTVFRPRFLILFHSLKAAINIYSKLKSF